MRGIKLILFILLLAGCEEVLFEAQLADTPVTNFEYLWEASRDRYSFFELKQIDWDQYYAENRPLVGEDISQDSLFNILAGMLNALQDGHVNLNAPFNRSRFDFSLLGPVNFDWRNIKENYIGEDYYISGPLSHNFLANNEVGYIRYASFTQAFSNYHISFVLNRYLRTKGLILDIRSNGGGNISNVYRLLNFLHETPTLLYTSSIKSGSGHEDFSAPVEVFSEPIDNPWPRKVVVLVDRQSFSASSFFALGAKAIDNMVLMGDTTGGGLGLPNGGQLPNGWTYRFSITQTIDPEGNNYENGVPPDVVSILTDEDRIGGRDRVIEDAIELILSP